MSIGHKLKMLREREGLSQMQLGKIVGVANSTLSLYEANKRRPDYDVLCRLADYFDVSVDYIMGRTEQKMVLTNNMLEIASGHDSSSCLYSSVNKHGVKKWDELVREMEEEYLAPDDLIPIIRMMKQIRKKEE